MSNFDHFVGTKPVSEAHAFDVQALSQWMNQHVAGFAGPVTVEMFRGWAIQPDLQTGHAGAQLRHALQAWPGGQVAALSACD